MDKNHHLWGKTNTKR